MSVTTPREKLQDKVLLVGRMSQILKKEDATRYRSACVRLSFLEQGTLDLAETTKHVAQRLSEPPELDFIPLQPAAQVGSHTWKAGSTLQRYIEKLSVCGNEAGLCFSTTTTLQICRFGILLTVGPHTPLPEMSRASEMKMEMKEQKQTISYSSCEHRKGCKAE